MDDSISRRVAIGCVLASPINGWVKEYLIQELETAPSAQPERKRGKWTNVNEGRWNVLEVLKCSACGEIDNRMYRTDSYCPNCGADMRERGGE